MSSDETTSPIKEILYSELARFSEREIQSAIAENSKSLMRAILSDCVPKIADIDMSDAEGIAVFAESLLHYVLTNALVPSQRKVTVNYTHVDVVIPDVRTLISSPKCALVLHFVRTDEVRVIRDEITQIKSIQPINENIWLVSKNNHDMPYKTYVVDASANFVDMLDDIRGFVNSNAHSKFRIFKVSE